MFLYPSAYKYVFVDEWVNILFVSGLLDCDRPYFSIIQFLWHHALYMLYCSNSMFFLYLAHSALVCHCYVAHLKHFVLRHVNVDGHA